MLARSRRVLQTAVVGLVGLVLGGCGGYYGDPSQGGSGNWAPQVTYAFPDPGIQNLPELGNITFNAAGLDSDSLVLQWEWQLDGTIQALGESLDGVFDEAWTLEWSEETSGFLHDVHFIVRDDELATELYWPVDVE